MASDSARNGNATDPKDGPKEPDLIDLVNSLQNKLAASGHTLDVPLPQIVVVGCQSAGKSSVLENIVKREFLPRGSNVVTRRPTVVQLHPTNGEEYGVFLHKPDIKFTDFNEIKEEIKAETNRVPGPVGFSSLPISLEIHSPHVIKLTLVDLPGLIKNAVDGQAQRNIEEVREMVLSYIKQPESLILAVSPANQDIANSDALEIAREADSKRERTIGVLTKLDLMDEGTDAQKILENLVLPLKRGYVGVLNRSQKSIEEGKDIKYILEEEKKFFATKECYKHLAHRMGTPYLRKLLQKMLKQHIKSFLPKVRDDLTKKLSSYSRELREFEKVMGDGPDGKQYYIIKLVQKFVSDIEVKLTGHSELVDMEVIRAGAHINYKLYTEIQKNMNLPLEPDEENIIILVANMNGIRNGLSVPTLTLDAICRRLINKFKQPLEMSVQSVADVFSAAIVESASMMDSYPSLKNELLYKIRSSIDRETQNTNDRLKMHIDAEMFCINLSHPDFDFSHIDPVAPAAGPVKFWDSTESDGDDPGTTSSLLKKLKNSEQTQVKVRYITVIIMKYLEIVRKQIGDVAIKYILYFLVKKVLDYIKKDLVPTLATTKMTSLTEDCEDDFRRKEEMEATCNCLREALNAIQAF